MSARLRELSAAVRKLEGQIAKGGGAERTLKVHAQGKLSARERIEGLRDKGTRFLEIGMLVAHDKYDGQAPAAGVVTGIGAVHGRLCVMVANDPTVKAGSWWPETIPKILRAQEIAMRCRIPIIYLVDSAGVNLPYQGGVFPGQYGAARIFYYNSIMRRYLRVPQLAAVMGQCVAGGAYLPALSDVILMVKGTSFMGLAGPNLVKGATGEVVDSETLGGAVMHTEVSGVAHYAVENDAECLERLRELVGRLPVQAVVSAGDRPGTREDRIGTRNSGFSFTERVRKVLAMAQEEASRLEHEYIGTEHILLGLIREGEGVAATVLRNLNVDLDEIRQTILGILKKGSAPQAGGLPYTSRSKKVLELAMAEASDLSHSYVGTEHLLLGLLREERGIAAQVLAEAGINLDAARAETLRLVGTSMPQGGTAATAGKATPAEALYDLLPSDHRMSYDMHALLRAIVDEGALTEFQPELAKEMICADARIGGIPVGIIANLRELVKRPGEKPRIGGIIYTDSAEKTAFFIERCDKEKLPILFVQDVSGFMVGPEAEQSGIIRAGARFVEAMACARSPKIVLTINHASGAGYYAMAGQGFDPDFIFTWPTGRMGVMEGESAIQAVHGRALETAKTKGSKLPPEVEKSVDEMREDYEHQLDAKYAAARGFVDAIVHPEDTREVLVMALTAALQNPGPHLGAFVL